MATRSSFGVTVPVDHPVGSTLVVGQTHFGMAGVTAADYLVRHLDATEVGHVSTEAVPAIAPFEDGLPRHHSRLYAVRDADLSVLVGELFVPMASAASYAAALLEWVESDEVDEIVVLHGVPFPHGPEEHEDSTSRPSTIASNGSPGTCSVH